ncbi:MAG: DUF4369 domain-containing protein [Muribaculaceae bacterium]|nr:DUF4369 domain-containing protein [Muribaculaceae bacterium]
MSLLLALVAALILSGCGKSDHFTVGGTIEAAGMQTVIVTYYASGGLKRVSQPAVDGKFNMKCESPVPTLCLVELSDGTQLASVIASNGDNIQIKASLEEPLLTEVKGNSSSSKLARWTRDNAELITSGNAEAINRSIAEFVRDNKSDMASSALMVTRFQSLGYETLADSLLTLISVSARPAPVVQNFSAVLSSQLSRKGSTNIVPMTVYTRNDSTYFYSPTAHTISMLAFVGDDRAGRDSITSSMRALCREFPAKRRLDIVEISTARDSAVWKSATARDSALWHQAWAPGTVASATISKMSVPRLPYFIVADSTGAQIYRGPSITEAERIITSRLR